MIRAYQLVRTICHHSFINAIGIYGTLVLCQSIGNTLTKYFQYFLEILANKAEINYRPDEANQHSAEGWAERVRQIVNIKTGE